MASNTYDAVGNKLDMSEIITNISPSDTPLFSRIGRTKATAVTHEWLEDTLGEARENKKPEGYTYETEAGTPRIRLFNYTQIMHRGVHVTDTQEVVLKYGLTSEIAYQMRKTLQELAFDCEYALIRQDTKILGAMDSARQFGGLPYWIVSNVFDKGGPRPLTFDEINNALEQTWTAGGKPSILLMSPRNKRVVSTMTAGNTKYMDGNKTNKLTQMIAVLETDFGTIECVTDRFMLDDVIYGLSPEYMKDDTSETGTAEISGYMKLGRLSAGRQILIKGVYAEHQLPSDTCSGELSAGKFTMTFKGNNSRRKCLVRDWAVTPEINLKGAGSSVSSAGIELAEM